MKRKEMLAALKDRIQPLENSEAGLLRGGFTEFELGTDSSSKNNTACIGNESCADNITCRDNDLCSNNGTCANNGNCEDNAICIAKPTKSAGDEVLDYSTIF